MIRAISLFWLLVAGAALIPGVATGTTEVPARTTMTIYAIPLTVQFMDHADDRLRGMSTNPFNISKSLVIVSGGVEKKNGPFPGDDVLYTFRLYSTSTKKKQLGTAIFTCYYDFSKHAICNSYFELDGGLIVASGSVSFQAAQFTLSITGGTKSYLGALGQVTSRPAPNDAQRFDLRVEGLGG